MNSFENRLNQYREEVEMRRIASDQLAMARKEEQEVKRRNEARERADRLQQQSQNIHVGEVFTFDEANLAISFLDYMRERRFYGSSKLKTGRSFKAKGLIWTVDVPEVLHGYRIGALTNKNAPPGIPKRPVFLAEDETLRVAQSFAEPSVPGHKTSRFYAGRDHSSIDVVRFSVGDNEQFRTGTYYRELVGGYSAYDIEKGITFNYRGTEVIRLAITGLEQVLLDIAHTGRQM